MRALSVWTFVLSIAHKILLLWFAVLDLCSAASSVVVTFGARGIGVPFRPSRHNSVICLLGFLPHSRLGAGRTNWLEIAAISTNSRAQIVTVSSRDHDCDADCTVPLPPKLLRSPILITSSKFSITSGSQSGCIIGFQGKTVGRTASGFLSFPNLDVIWVAPSSFFPFPKPPTYV